MIVHDITRHIVAVMINASSFNDVRDLSPGDLIKLKYSLKTTTNKIIPKGTIVEVESVTADKGNYSHVVILRSLDRERVRLVYDFDEPFNHDVI